MHDRDVMQAVRELREKTNLHIAEANDEVQFQGEEADLALVASEEAELFRAGVYLEPEGDNGRRTWKL